LKSNCNTFGALTLGAMAKELELTNVSKVSESGAQPLAALADEYSRVAAALAELRHA
jgi:HPt (histidine-containing phosphotransfer) domain-containing protein